MNVYENLNANDMVHPQDVPVSEKGGVAFRYGGLTKREYMVTEFVAAMIFRAGIPPTPEAASAVAAGCIMMADGLRHQLKLTPESEPSLIERPGPGGLVS